MKKFIMTTVIFLAVGLAMIFIGSILQGINWTMDFDGTHFAEALNNIGYLVSTLSGVALTAGAVSCAVRGDNCENKSKDTNESEKNK